MLVLRIRVNRSQYQQINKLQQKSRLPLELKNQEIQAISLESKSFFKVDRSTKLVIVQGIVWQQVLKIQVWVFHLAWIQHTHAFLQTHVPLIMKLTPYPKEIIKLDSLHLESCFDFYFGMYQIIFSVYLTDKKWAKCGTKI